MLVVRAANFFILGVDKLYCLQYNRDRDKEREAERQGGNMQDSRKRANTKWLKENYESITIRVPKGTRERIKGWADASGVSMAAYIQQACREKAEKVSDRS